MVNIWSRCNTEQFSALYTGGDNYIHFPHLDTVQKLHFLLKWGIKIQSLKVGNSKVCVNQSLPSVCQTNVEKNAALQVWILESSSQSCLFDLHPAAPLFHQAKKTTKMMKKMTRTKNILIISQRLEETDWKYLRISMCAPSTFNWVSSTLASILEQSETASSTTQSLFIKLRQERLIIKLLFSCLCWMEMVYTAKQFSLCRNILERI